MLHGGTPNKTEAVRAMLGVMIYNKDAVAEHPNIYKPMAVTRGAGASLPRYHTHDEELAAQGHLSNIQSYGSMRTL